MSYYLDENDNPYAMDSEGNEFYVTKEGLIPARKGRIDYIMWENVTKKRAEECA